MIFRVTFKTPDAVEYAIKDIISDIDSDEGEEQFAEAKEATEKWVKYGELVTVEFNTEAGTATVIPVGG